MQLSGLLLHHLKNWLKEETMGCTRVNLIRSSGTLMSSKEIDLATERNANLNKHCIDIFCFSQLYLTLHSKHDRLMEHTPVLQNVLPILESMVLPGRHLSVKSDVIETPPRYSASNFPCSSVPIKSKHPLRLTLLCCLMDLFVGPQ